MLICDMQRLSGIGRLVLPAVELLRRGGYTLPSKSQEIFLGENFLKHFFLWDSVRQAKVSHRNRFLLVAYLFVLFKSMQRNFCSFKNVSTKVIWKDLYWSSKINIINVEIAIYHFKTQINFLLNMRHNVLSEENICFAFDAFV